MTAMDEEALAPDVGMAAGADTAEGEAPTERSGRPDRRRDQRPRAGTISRLTMVEASSVRGAVMTVLRIWRRPAFAIDRLQVLRAA
ncbi:MAG: hypothetical protein B7Y01_00950 [Xanthobacter sp. 17-67-6]|nr:MAG: hypothetical protein B7Y01_00950 [Xanthobacter sp. 17-67-6]